LERDILILANSRRPGGSCIAGKDIATKRWIRPIGNGDNHAITKRNQCIQYPCDNRRGCPDCLNYCKPNVLNIVRVDLRNHVPNGHQNENYINNHNFQWRLNNRNNIDCYEYLDNPNTLWENETSTSNGLFDRVKDIGSCNNSLYLIQPETFGIHVIDEGYNNEQKIRLRGEFEYNGIKYNIRITDSNYEDEYLTRNLGYYSLISENHFLCISLAETEYHGYYYKLIAGICNLN